MLKICVIIVVKKKHFKNSPRGIPPRPRGSGIATVYFLEEVIRKLKELVKVH